MWEWPSDVSGLAAQSLLWGALSQSRFIQHELPSERHARELFFDIVAARPDDHKLRDGIGVDRPLQASQTGSLVYNSMALATSNDLVNKIDTLTAGAGITLTGTGSSRTIQANLAQINLVAPLFTSSVGTNSVTIESHWKPSNVTVSSGLLALSNDAAGPLHLCQT